ncbi:hypothetical protein [Pseudonocardia sp. ICBG1142]|uniref:hypothetical protein n=1 Tax=Pseudonocardia sp. ICBG1142 TaxID=2846760 RepID=UPI0021075CBC|nr:hypothetical protein [Pseudonocardia sp. ICBG1142]
MVTGVEQDLGGAEDVQGVAQLAGVAWQMDRRGGEPDLLADVLRRHPVHPRHLAADAAPLLVQPPQQRRQPGRPALGDGHPQSGQRPEGALGDQRHQLGLRDLPVGQVVLQVGVGEPGRGRGAADPAPGVQGDDQPGRGGRGEDRPEHRVTPAQVVAAHREQHLHEARVVRPVLDLGDGRRRVTERHGDRPAGAGLVVEEPLRDPGVHRPAQGGLERVVAADVERGGAGQDRRGDPSATGGRGVEDGGAQGRHVVWSGALDHRGRVGTGLDGVHAQRGPQGVVAPVGAQQRREVGDRGRCDVGVGVEELLGRLGAHSSLPVRVRP